MFLQSVPIWITQCHTLEELDLEEWSVAFASARNGTMRHKEQTSQGLILVPGSYRWIGRLLCGLMGSGWLWATLVFAAPADEVIPIGSITVNPMANNRRAVMLQGQTKNVMAYQGEDGFGRSLCGQGFILIDETGSIDVLYLIRCQANETPVLVDEGERVLVRATIDVSFDKGKSKEGKEMAFKAMATQIIRGK